MVYQKAAKVRTEEHKRELNRPRMSRVLEVTKERVKVEMAMIAKCNRHFDNIRDYQVRRDPFDMIRLLQSQAFKTNKCLEALKAGGSDIPQGTIDVFDAHEKQYEEETSKLDVGEVPETNLTLSPPVLASQFVDVRLMAGLDEFGSNADLIDVNAIAVRCTPNASRETSHTEDDDEPLASKDLHPESGVRDPDVEGLVREEQPINKTANFIPSGGEPVVSFTADSSSRKQDNKAVDESDHGGTVEESDAKSDEPPQRDASDAPSKDSEEDVADPPEAIASETGLSAEQVVHTGEAQGNAGGARVDV